MFVAVIGCLHGELDVIYERIEQMEKQRNITVSLVLVCGDFQTIRNNNDLQCMAVPPKYRRLGTFHQYYFGDKVAPKLTLLIGGNHEASNYLQTLPYGGWVAPNMYYLGYCSVVKFGGLRIGGISGIFGKNRDAHLSHFERLPYDQSTLRSVYHTRLTEVYKLLQLCKQTEDASDQLLDVFMSHDWPVNIHTCGNVDELLRKKWHFRDEVNRNCLGNPLLQPLVHHLKPRHWFAAHLHVNFRATVNFTRPSNQENVDGAETPNHSPLSTHFQSLDKVLPHKRFLEIFEINPVNPSESTTLEYDPEWLTILKKTDHLMQVDRQEITFSQQDISRCANEISVTPEEIEQTIQLFNGNLSIPDNFERSEPVVERSNDRDPKRQLNFSNPQTTKLCKLLDIRDVNQLILDANKVVNPDEIDLEDDSESELVDELATKRAKTDDLFFIDTKGKLNH